MPTCLSEDDPDAARDHVRSLIAFYVGAMGDYYANAVSSFGFDEEATAIRDGWRADRQAGAEAAVTDEMVLTFGAAGTPAEAADSFELILEAGATSPVAYVRSRWGGDDVIRETIRHL